MFSVGDRIMTLRTFYKTSVAEWGKPVPPGTIGTVFGFTKTDKLYFVGLTDGYKYLYAYKEDIVRI